MNQCPSCGGWCGYTKANGCNYADLPIQQDLQTMISRNGELESQMQGLSNEINDFQNIIERQKREIDDLRTVEPMTSVADRYAHRLALELECVLADRNANWDRAMNLIGEYRSAMNAIHEQHSPTHMGEPVLGAAIGGAKP